MHPSAPGQLQRLQDLVREFGLELALDDDLVQLSLHVLELVFIDLLLLELGLQLALELLRRGCSCRWGCR